MKNSLPKYWIILGFSVFVACTINTEEKNSFGDLQSSSVISQNPYVIVLGTVQDGGSPHIGCQKDCCSLLFENPDASRMVVSLGLVDPISNSTWLIEASPDLSIQLKLLQNEIVNATKTPNGVFITHAHIGHYTGLMYFGREALGTDSTHVYTMPGMSNFLQTNGPWDQLVELGNIKLETLKADSAISLGANLMIIPFLVPHRDEYSETVGFKIEGPNKSLLFIPDINKWQLWDRNIVEEIREVDYAFIDATFYDAAEVGHRDINEIPHPFVIESMALFDTLSSIEKSKVHFIHLNHTNPLLDTTSKGFNEVYKKGYKVATFKQRVAL